jgi:predicted PurR-regulated permease PerM
MNQNTHNHLTSALLGGVFGLGGVAIGTITAIGVTLAVLFGALAATPAGILAIAITAGITTVAASTAVHCFRRRGGESFKPVSALIGGLATIATGIGLIFASNPKAIKSLIHFPEEVRSLMQISPPTPAPVENAKRVSFLDHKDSFNTSAQNNKKTLALTAKDFSPPAIAAQKSMTA